MSKPRVEKEISLDCQQFSKDQRAHFVQITECREKEGLQKTHSVFENLGDNTCHFLPALDFYILIIVRSFYRFLQIPCSPLRQVIGSKYLSRPYSVPPLNFFPQQVFELVIFNRGVPLQHPPPQGILNTSQYYQHFKLRTTL